ncbi:hypothetical protein GH141_07475, partial [bacterium]|nr:hypothetical protein [bacterium]
MRLSATDVTASPAGSGWDQYTGYGRINAKKACEWVIPPYYLDRRSWGAGYLHLVNEDWEVTFSNPPHPNEDKYPADDYRVDRYQLAVVHTPPEDPLPDYPAPPIAWLNVVGMDNDTKEDLVRSQDIGTVYLTTYFYKLKKRKWLGIYWNIKEVWAPCNPYDFTPFKSVVIYKEIHEYDGKNGFEDNDEPSYINMPWSYINSSREGVRYPIGRRVKASDEGITG